MKEISDNLLSAFFDGNANAIETEQVLGVMQDDPELKEVAELSQKIDQALAVPDILPMAAMAADNTDRNRCVMLCELFILRRHGIERSEGEWEKQAQRQGWLRESGTALFNIGRLLEQECFSTSRTYHNNIDGIREALNRGEDVIAVVDSHELTTNRMRLDKEYIHDFEYGKTPNHAVVIASVSDDNVVYYDPATDSNNSLPVTIFEQAWQDSDCYMVCVHKRNFAVYRPHPLDLSDVELPDDIEDLREAIAENAHEVWAETRQSEVMDVFLV